MMRRELHRLRWLPDPAASSEVARLHPSADDHRNFFRLADEAVNDVRSTEGMPTSTTMPPGRTAAIADSVAAGSPEASKATSRPRPLVAATNLLNLLPLGGRQRGHGCPHSYGSRQAVLQAIGGNDIGKPRRSERSDQKQPDRA